MNVNRYKIPIVCFFWFGILIILLSRMVVFRWVNRGCTNLYGGTFIDVLIKIFNFFLLQSLHLGLETDLKNHKNQNQYSTSKL